VSAATLRGIAKRHRGDRGNASRDRDVFPCMLVNKITGFIPVMIGEYMEAFRLPLAADSVDGSTERIPRLSRA
jgi:hypothetical protein